MYRYNLLIKSAVLYTVCFVGLSVYGFVICDLKTVGIGLLLGLLSLLSGVTALGFLDEREKSKLTLAIAFILSLPVIIFILLKHTILKRKGGGDGDY